VIFFFVHIFLILCQNALSQRRDTIIEVINHDPRPYFQCTAGACHGYTVDYYENQQTHIEGKFKHGKTVGLIKTYYKTGQLQDERNFRNGKLIHSIIYDSVGKLSRDLDFRKQIITEYQYDDQGKVERKIVFNWKGHRLRKGERTVFINKNGNWIKE
jgi:hypothetical protein